MSVELAQIIQSLAEAAAALIAAVALLAGFVQYRRSELWKQEEFVAGLVRGFEADVRIQRALTSLDWRSRRIDLLDVGGADPQRWVKVTDELCESALRPPDAQGFKPEEIRLRDCFDHLFSELDRFNVFIERGLVGADSFEPYLTYWLDIVGNPNSSYKPRSLQHAMWRFIDDYGYVGMQRLCRRFGYHIQPPVRLQPGDIFFTRGRHWLSRAIRFFTRRFGEPRTKVNHVGVVVAPGWMKNEPVDQASGLTNRGDAEAVVVEALSRVKMHSLASEYLDDKTEVAVYRPVGVPVDAAVDWAKQQVGNPYGWARIIGHFLDWFLLGAYVFRRLFRAERYPICSFLVAQAFERVSAAFFGKEPNAASPDDLWDFVTALPNGPRFECVRDLALMRE